MVRRYVAELALTVDSSGTLQTFRFATSGFTTRPTDTPANTHIDGVLVHAGSFTSEMFSGQRVGGGVRPAWGDLILANQDGELDDFFGYGVSGSKVTVRMGEEGAPYPAGYEIVFIAYAHNLLAEFESIRVRLRDRRALLDKPLVTAGFGGTGGLDGTGVIAKLKQWVSGDPGYIPPILLDASSQIYFVQSTGTGGLSALFECYHGGEAVTKGSNYSSNSDIVSNAPGPTEVRFWFGSGGNGPVYMRLGFIPTFDLRVYVQGAHSSGAAWTLGHLAQLAGVYDAGLLGSVGNVLVDDGRSILSIMEEACKGSFDFFGFTRLDVFTVDTLAEPDVTPLMVFDEFNAADFERAPVQDMNAPVWSLIVEAGKTWPSNLKGSVGSTMADYLTRTPYWTGFGRADGAVLTAHPGAASVRIAMQHRRFQNQFSQENFLDDFIALFGVPRDFISLTAELTSETLALELNDTAQVRVPRFDMTAGKNMRLITRQIDTSRDQLRLGFWG